MSNLIKENNIFEEVEKRCQSFIESDPLLNAYRKKEWNDYFYKDELAKAEEKGIERGIKEGELNKAISMAKSMKKENIDIEVIKRITGLSLEEIEKL